MKVLLTKALHAGDRDYLAERLDPSIELIEPSAWNEAGVIARIGHGDIGALLGGMASEPVLAAAAAHRVRLVQIPWTGVDNLDLDAIERHDVAVCNSHSNATVVAEHALALLLCAIKKLAYHDRRLRTGDWNRVRPGGNAVSPFSGTLVGARVVLVGLGAIGRAMVRLLAGFDARIETVTASGAPSPGIGRVWVAADLVEAVAGADAVVLALPLTSASRGLVDAAALAAMGPRAVLVNVSRGAPVDEDALYAALAGGGIGAAAIDTWWQGPTATSPCERRRIGTISQPSTTS